MADTSEGQDRTVVNINEREELNRPGLIISRLYPAIFTIVAILWLIGGTDLEIFRASWILLMGLAVLRIGVSQLDVSSLSLDGTAYLKGSPGRMITWSAVLIFGPVALWLDLAAAFVNVIIWLQKQRRKLRFEDFWPAVRHFSLIPVRDTVPAIASILLFQSMAVFGSELLSEVGISGLLIETTLTKTALSIVTLLPLYIAENSFSQSQPGYFSRLAAIIRSLRLLLGAVLVLGLIDLAGLASGNFYSTNNPGLYFGVMVALSIIALFLHHTNKIGQKRDRLAQSRTQLLQISELLLSMEPDEQNLPQLLAEFSPRIFPGAVLEVQLFASQQVFRFGTNSGHKHSVQDSQPMNAPRYDLRSGPADILSSGRVEAIVDRDNRRIIGSLVLTYPDGSKINDRDRSALTALADLIASSVRQTELFGRALESQAEAFQNEVYTQVYEAELKMAYERVAQELAIAGEIQTSFLPDSVPDIPGWQITVYLEPARETSGDYYDFIKLPDGLFGFLVADVTDKGIGSALYMALSRTIIRTFAAQYRREPARVLEAANRRILEDTNSDLFVTVFYGILDPETGSVVYCNAGQNPPLFWQIDGEEQPQSLIRTALPLGIFQNESWEQETIQIMPGSLLALYTDGVTEAQDEAADMFGEGRLLNTIQENLDKPAAIIEDKVLSALNNFTQDAPQFDDITLMIIQRER